MAILERIEPIRNRWTPARTPAVTVADDEYAGRHRRPGHRRLSLLAMLYTPAHAHYVPRHTMPAGTAARYVARHRRLG